MKTPEEIEHARHTVIQAMTQPGLSDVQKAMFCGITTALCWVCDNPNGSTLARLLTGEPVAAGKDHGPALEKLTSFFNCPKCGQPKAHSRLRGMFCMTCD